MRTLLRHILRTGFFEPRAMSSLPRLPILANTDPSTCILDSFRIAIAKIVSEALPPLTLEQAYNGINYGKKGVDFTVALPRYRLPGKVDELARQVTNGVSFENSLNTCVLTLHP